MDVLAEKCRENGIDTIRGYYYPTKKNGMVREHYGTLGFDKISEEDDGSSVWELKVSGYTNQNKHIEILKEN